MDSGTIAYADACTDIPFGMNDDERRVKSASLVKNTK